MIFSRSKLPKQQNESTARLLVQVSLFLDRIAIQHRDTFACAFFNFCRDVLGWNVTAEQHRSELGRHGYHELSEEQLRPKDDPKLCSSKESACG
jgi:hypothetical protein